METDVLSASPEWISWALERMKHGLIVRVMLEASGIFPARPWRERVLVSIRAHHHDHQEPSIGCFSYSNYFGPKGIGMLTPSVDEEAWPQFLGRSVENWDEGWRPQQDFICLLKQRDGLEAPIEVTELAVTDSLVLQHLARVEGELSGAQKMDITPPERALLWTMEHRLNAIIANANEERTRLLARLF